MINLYLLFSHKLTEKQKEDARDKLNIDEFVYLPKSLQNKWSNIPPDKEEIKEYLLPICDWLTEKTTLDDYLLIQGEFGSAYLMVRWAKDNNLIPIYSTTKRKTKEIRENGKIKTIKEFEHKQFREYEDWD